MWPCLCYQPEVVPKCHPSSTGVYLETNLEWSIRVVRSISWWPVSHEARLQYAQATWLHGSKRNIVSWGKVPGAHRLSLFLAWSKFVKNDNCAVVQCELDSIHQWNYIFDWGAAIRELKSSVNNPYLADLRVHLPDIFSAVRTCEILISRNFHDVGYFIHIKFLLTYLSQKKRPSIITFFLTVNSGDSETLQYCRRGATLFHSLIRRLVLPLWMVVPTLHWERCQKQVERQSSAKMGSHSIGVCETRHNWVWNLT